MIGQGTKIDRRTVLTGAGVAALVPVTANAYSGDERGLADDVSAPWPGSAARFQAISTATMSRMPSFPFFLSTVYQGERPALPMIDVPLTKENALPFDLWGLIYKDWKPTPEEGVTVFLQGLENRGDNNLRKKIYFSAMTPDLYGRSTRRRSSPSSTSCRPGSRESRSCGITSTIISTSTGISISA